MTETDSKSDLVAFFIAEPILASLTSPSFAHLHLLAPVVSVAISGLPPVAPFVATSLSRLLCLSAQGSS
ncbi:hypothetical protein M378DRAFT_18172 [Amanita muscaria Koide BX008]|uniref:Uncharacterized protein n=1 Tax=Amanita muscaria (strain Koide BX008) TaxID=946122 RepID=A0A0C2SMJ5_AMAMK|nr:hypothetical protein M378DRAFT_18172 [Amanita muscaria Koide BX008]